MYHTFHQRSGPSYYHSLTDKVIPTAKFDHMQHSGLHDLEQYYAALAPSSHFYPGETLCHPPLMHAPYEETFHHSPNITYSPTSSDGASVGRLSPIAMARLQAYHVYQQQQELQEMQEGYERHQQQQQQQHYQQHHIQHHPHYNDLPEPDSLATGSSCLTSSETEIGQVERSTSALSHGHGHSHGHDSRNARIRMMRAAAAAMIESPLLMYPNHASGSDDQMDHFQVGRSSAGQASVEDSGKEASTPVEYIPVPLAPSTSSPPSPKDDASVVSSPPSGTKATLEPSTTSEQPSPPPERKTSVRRAEQNRTAQRAFRQRRQHYVKDLEAKAQAADAVDAQIAEADARLTDIQCLAERLAVDRENWMRERSLWWTEREEAMDLANALVQDLDSLNKENVKLQEVMMQCRKKIDADTSVENPASEKRSATDVLQFSDLLNSDTTMSSFTVGTSVTIEASSQPPPSKRRNTAEDSFAPSTTASPSTVTTTLPLFPRLRHHSEEDTVGRHGGNFHFAAQSAEDQ
ncbi:hypothetical protein HKX48_005017 [Thoreauomyces humboldtii]|nr:hypothetical protein HKX48_005017 [Thoreauomyces humboldtii]